MTDLVVQPSGTTVSWPVSNSTIRRYLTETIDNQDFEHVVANLWKSYGFETTVTQQSRDKGVDVLAQRETPITHTHAVQAKQYAPGRTLGQKVVERYASLNLDSETDNVAVVTTASFTQPARDLADERDVQLINGDMLVRQLAEQELLDTLAQYVSLNPPTPRYTISIALRLDDMEDDEPMLAADRDSDCCTDTHHCVLNVVEQYSNFRLQKPALESRVIDMAEVKNTRSVIEDLVESGHLERLSPGSLLPSIHVRCEENYWQRCDNTRDEVADALYDALQSAPRSWFRHYELNSTVLDHHPELDASPVTVTDAANQLIDKGVMETNERDGEKEWGLNERERQVEVSL